MKTGEYILEEGKCIICRSEAPVINRKLEGPGLPELTLYDCPECGGWYWIDGRREAILEHPENRRIIPDLKQKLRQTPRDFDAHEYPIIQGGGDGTWVGIHYKGKLVVALPVPPSIG